MAQLTFTYPDFFIKSDWDGYYDPPPIVHYSDPSTRTANPVFALTGLPADAVIDSAVLASALGSPYTGAAIRQVDGVAFSGSMDVAAKIRGLNGNYGAGVSFEYKFKANGGAGGFGDHEASLGFSANSLSITYHMPADTGTLDRVDVNAGEIIRLQGITQSGGYTHRARWSMGGQEVAHDLVAGDTLDELTVPMAWLTTIPNAMAGGARVILETYSGSTLMGSVTYTFTVHVPATVKPTVSLTVAPYSDTNPAVPSAWGLYVKGRSKARLTATAQGAYGSDIASYQFTAPGQPNPYTTPLLGAAGQLTYTCKVTDSRGQTQTSAPVTITVTDYDVPTISRVSFARCLADKTLSDTGTYIRVQAVLGYTSLGGKNAVTTRLAYYRRAGDAAWLPAGGFDLASLTPDAAVGAGGISTDYTYQVKIELADSLTPADNPVPYIGYISSNVLYDIRPDRAAFGRRATSAKEFALPDDWTQRYKGQDLDARFPRKSNPDGIMMTGVSTGEKDVRFENCGQGLQTVQLYGSASSSTNVCGLWDVTNARAVWYYNGAGDFIVPRPMDILNDLTATRGIFTSAVDAAAGAANAVALIAGSPTGAHIEIDTNEIMAKSSGTAATVLHLNAEGGDVQINNNMAYHRGNVQHGTTVVSLPDGHLYIKHS